MPRDEYSGTSRKNSKPELVIEAVELLKNRIAVNASLGNHVNVEDARASRRALIAKIRTENHDYPAKPDLAKGLFYTVFHALYRAGGVNNIGSLRDIRLVRNGETIEYLDVYEFRDNPIS